MVLSKSESCQFDLSNIKFHFSKIFAIFKFSIFVFHEIKRSISVYNIEKIKSCQFM